MSRIIRRRLFETLETLEKANELLHELLNELDGEKIYQLLTDCQETAIQMGNQIEAVYKGQEECVHDLEVYCESTYNMTQLWEEPQEMQSVLSDMVEQLRTLREDMEANIPDKLEVVFLPYKACMWDSLESVWKAKAADEECETYVVPIPYYDRNSDGSFGEGHWDGNEYPSYVPITKCDEYDFTVRYPDVTYIHNPYDQCNYVVSVHPFFYSSNLVKYTEKLIYIPYFVLEEIDPSNEVALEHVRSLIVQPVVVNAHQVIVQSENIRELYINEMMKVSKDMGVSREYWEKKILALGSPKVDKVLNTKREDVEIPEEWLHIIQKPDGSWKKIILYNTSVSAILHSSDKILPKIRSVFEIFKSNQDDVALLWRPHPLTRETLLSMRSGMVEEYDEIVAEYRAAGWGIYDDTSDMNRAIALSDAYYGTGSSLTYLYRQTGKPMMLQNVNVL